MFIYFIELTVQGSDSTEKISISINQRNIFGLHCPINVQVSPVDVVVSSHGPGQWGVSGRGQWGGAYRLAAAHVGAYMVVLMWGVRWRSTHNSYFTILSYIKHNFINVFLKVCTFMYFKYETSSSD